MECSTDIVAQPAYDSDLSSAMDVDWPEQSAKGDRMKQEPGEDNSGIAKTRHNLRRRGATDISPYLAPWQQERKLRQLEKSITRVRTEDETEDEMDNSDRLAKVSLTQSPPLSEDGVSMILRAAILFEQNMIFCSSFGCPIQTPHGEGIYRHTEQVLDSELANSYFAPSLPPPCVVEAFNRIGNNMSSLDDLYIKDYFFDYHTAPCRPSKHLRKVGKQPCKSQICGCEEQPHSKGLYLHNGLDASYGFARRVNHLFGIANPPPQVWDAAFRVIDGIGDKIDYQLVDDFSAHHVRLEDGATGREQFMKWQKQRRTERH